MKTAKTSKIATAQANPAELPLFAIPLLVFTAFLVFYRIFSHGFVTFDDDVYVYNNPHMLLGGWAFIKSVFTGFAFYNWQPLLTILIRVEYGFFGIHGGGYHVVSLLLHTLNAFLVLRIFTGLSKDWRVGLLVALLFLIHPMHVENVAWVSSQKDLLYVLFYLAGLWGYIRYIEKGGRKYLIATLFFFLCSCMSKGVAVTFPVALLVVIDACYKRKFVSKSLGEKIFFALLFLCAVSVGALAVVAMSYDVPGEEVLSQKLVVAFPTWKRILFACYAFAQYVVKAFMPMHHSAMHPYPDKSLMDSIPLVFYIGPGIVVLYFFLIYWFRKDNLIAPWLFFFPLNIALLLQWPLSVGGFVIWERYTYLSYLGILFPVALLIIRLHDRINNQWLVKGAVCVVLLIYGYCANMLTVVWKDTISLYENVIKEYPRVLNAYMALGDAYMEKGDQDKAAEYYHKVVMGGIGVPEKLFSELTGVWRKNKRPDTAANIATIALKTYPESWMLLGDRGWARMEMDSFYTAAADFERCVALNPQLYQIWFQLAVAYARLGDNEAALTALSQVLETDDPVLKTDAYLNRGKLLREQGKLEEAFAALKNAENISPQYASVQYELYLLYTQTGNEAEAQTALKRFQELSGKQ